MTHVSSFVKIRCAEEREGVVYALLLALVSGRGCSFLFISLDRQAQFSHLCFVAFVFLIRSCLFIHFVFVPASDSSFSDNGSYVLLDRYH